jgi:hypothetical protein
LPRIWLADEWAHPGKIDFADASAIVVGLMAAWETSPPRPGHKFTRANEFSGLSALLRNSLRFSALVCASRRESFISPRETKLFARGALSLWNH